MTRSTEKHSQPHGNLVDESFRLGLIGYRPIDELSFLARRARTHSEKQLCKLEASIREFGFIVPVLVNCRGEIIAGAARVDAARKAGLTELPTISVDHLSDAQVRAFRIADNRLAELGEWDLELLASEIGEILDAGEIEIDLLGWETAEIDVMLDDALAGASETSDPADEVMEPAAETISRLGDLWRLGKHRLICGSSLAPEVWERLLAGENASMGFSDPPYNVPVTGHVCGLGKVKHAEFAYASGEMSGAEFTAFLTTFLVGLASHCSDGAIIDVCIDWRHLPELLAAAREAGLSLINLCVWAKGNGGMGSLYRSQHELVLILKKGKAPHINNVELGKHGRYRTNVWQYAGVNSFGRNRDADLADHPTVKPVALVAEAIRDVTRHGDIVLDAFAGSGTTLLAAERTGRRGYGIEIEPKYVDVAIRRWEKLTGKPAILDATGETFAEVRSARQGTETTQLKAA